MKDPGTNDRLFHKHGREVTVTSAANEKVKLLRGLSSKQVRRRMGLTIVEGITLVNEALNSGAFFVTAAYDEEMAGSPRMAELISSLRTSGIEVWSAAHRVFKGMVQTETPQGILGVIRIPDSSFGVVVEGAISQARATGDGIVVLMDGVRDPGNAGLIARSSDAFGASCVIFGGASADPYNPKVLRASTGSVFHIPCVSAVDSAAVAGTLKTAGFKIFYGDAKAKIPAYEADFSGPVVIIAGNEAAGVSPLLRTMGVAIAVPIYGMAESLNVSMALTAMLYEARRQRSVTL